ncbi:RNA polymerase I-specific transcription initiation factor-domain-containing protein [Aspergillus caelatus]|uniref:RNA polymerase I-specific transcription initiation factor-domain-containing protein n=1 Tax=Aspergillus caelatus TaxID=61420 RepID=A0A5N6ZW62_9EURO|nr:RNA polymerase I-specific transcription initiation factor-domain-containing protein [Aspergillus caelatus]KAE8361625.1 RNA polymerase I-specific transcription initiation factor-domain-containing protein [Aspergillus caelatus]
MSSISGGRSPRFIPPQSAQPYTSIFGGSSSQDVADLQPYPEWQGDATFDSDDVDVAMEDIPIAEDDDSDDSTYKESDEDGPGPEAGGSQQRGPQSTGNAATGHSDIDSPPSSPAYRPNRFRGAESQWRKLTAEDRQNAEALETIRARDLAAHLYNAYALRVRARELARQAVEAGEPEDETKAFGPPKRWAAWPMSATEVPRGNEHVRRGEDEAWTLRMQPDPRPSAELEESLIAIMLKDAKEKFQSRPWDDKLSSVHQWAMSQANTQNNAATDREQKSDPGSIDEISLRPVVQADDEKSRLQLRPLTRNILTQFDDLLMALHNARNGGVGADDSSASEWQTDTESIASSISSRKRRTVKATAERSQSRGRKRTRRSSARTGSSRPRSHSGRASSGRASSRPRSRRQSNSEYSRPRGRSTGSDRKRSASRMRLGLRDWSEVLGIASMIGFPPDVVMRSSQRCAALFREDMEFRVLQEGTLQQVQNRGSSTWTYAEIEPEEAEASLPPPSPPRTKRSLSRTASVKKASSTRATSPATDHTDEVTKLKGKGQHRKQDIICPVRTCPRHINGFARTWNLNLHMRRMHPGYRPKSTDAKSKSSIVGPAGDTDG